MPTRPAGGQGRGAEEFEERVVRYRLRRPGSGADGNAAAAAPEYCHLSRSRRNAAGIFSVLLFSRSGSIL